MNKRMRICLFALLLCAVTACAAAQTAEGTAYGIYSMEGEHAKA